jgi:hypothetical protein
MHQVNKYIMCIIKGIFNIHYICILPSACVGCYEECDKMNGVYNIKWIKVQCRLDTCRVARVAHTEILYKVASSQKEKKKVNEFPFVTVQIGRLYS